MAGQIVQQAVEQSVLRVAKQLEQQLDSELHKLENLQDDDLERIRQRRVQDLKQQQDKAREWAARGHGEYREVFEEKEFFKEMKGEERMVCHFFRDNWPCKVCVGGVVGYGGVGQHGTRLCWERWRLVGVRTPTCCWPLCPFSPPPAEHHPPR
jgi:hypothetical protein